MTSQVDWYRWQSPTRSHWVALPPQATSRTAEMNGDSILWLTAANLDRLLGKSFAIHLTCLSAVYFLPADSAARGGHLVLSHHRSFRNCQLLSPSRPCSAFYLKLFHFWACSGSQAVRSLAMWAYDWWDISPSPFLIQGAPWKETMSLSSASSESSTGLGSFYLLNKYQRRKGRRDSHSLWNYRPLEAQSVPNWRQKPIVWCLCSSQERAVFTGTELRPKQKQGQF